MYDWSLPQGTSKQANSCVSSMPAISKNHIIEECSKGSYIHRILMLH